MSDIRFATIGTSDITRRFLDALSQLEGARLSTCYSRSADKARAFGADWGATNFVDDLADLAASPEVDAVYIASPNALHAPQAAQMIRAGKHVLIEKSLASNEAEAEELFALAHEKDVVCLEAMRNLHTPAFAAIEDAVDQLGDVRLATFRFSKVTSRMARLRAGERLNVFDPMLSEGALMDIGVYAVEPAVALFGRPDDVRALAVSDVVPGEEGSYSTVDLAGELLLGYGDKVVSCSYGKMSDDLLGSQIEGEDATLTWQDMSSPHDLVLTPHVDRGMVYTSAGTPGQPIAVETLENDMVFELEDFIAAVRGDADALADVQWYEQVTLDALDVMDEARSQIGVLFPADERYEGR